MDELLEKLKVYGADIEGAMGRFLGDVDLYKTCFTAFVQDEAFEKLGEAITDSDYEKAFECAHTLKGITGNMGLTPLYKVIYDMVELLRKHEYADIRHCYAEISEQLKSLKEFRKQSV
ncbi:MAG: Hpt domain-containing protein [Christensenella sp.]